MTRTVMQRLWRTLNAVNRVVPNGMAAYHRAGQTRINVFPVEETYLFKHYFEEDVFDELKRYYSSYDYRFEVPESRFGTVRGVLEENGYDPVILEEAEPFAVAQRKYTNHPNILFKGSVYQRSAGNFNVFVMKDRDAVEHAVTQGAIPIEDTDVIVTL